MSVLPGRKLWVFMVTTMTALVIACGSGSDSDAAAATPVAQSAEASADAPEISDDPNFGARHVIWEEFYWQPEDAEAARRADLVVVATVDTPGTPFWNTVSGERPGVTVDGKLVRVPKDQLLWGSFPLIYTPWTFTIRQTLKGEHTDPEPITLSWLGGEIPPDSVVQEKERAFAPGNDVVLFLKDCDQAREEKYDTRYRFIKRSLITPNGLVTAYVNDRLITLENLLEIVADEKDQPPEYEFTCA